MLLINVMLVAPMENVLLPLLNVPSVLLVMNSLLPILAPKNQPLKDVKLTLMVKLMNVKNVILITN